ncbi:MAG TPA: hypothetical protein VIY49_09140 [Bryobacteraceae bacterium]
MSRHVLPGAPIEPHHWREVTIHMKPELSTDSAHNAARRGGESGIRVSARSRAGRCALAPIFLLGAVNGAAAQLTPSAAQAFQGYVADVEARLVRQHAQTKTYLATLDVGSGQRNQSEGDLMPGEVRTEPVNGGTRQLDAALLHHWRGVAFIPGGTAKDMVALLRGRLPGHSAPEIVSSRVLADDGGTATLAVRFQKQVVIAIVIDAEYKVEAKLTGDGRGYGISRGTHFWKVDDPGTKHERRRPEGDDDGFLWRLNSYWSFVQAREGLEIECEAVSLTRDVPRGLGWLISPIVANLPRELLESTMTTTRNALAEIAAAEGSR